MKIADIKTKDTNELEALLKESQIKLGKLTFQRTGKTLSKPSELQKIKKEIARIKTVLHERNK